MAIFGLSGRLGDPGQDPHTRMSTFSAFRSAHPSSPAGVSVQVAVRNAIGRCWCGAVASPSHPYSRVPMVQPRLQARPAGIEKAQTVKNIRPPWRSTPVLRRSAGPKSTAVSVLVFSPSPDPGYRWPTLGILGQEHLRPQNRQHGRRLSRAHRIKDVAQVEDSPGTRQTVSEM